MSSKKLILCSILPYSILLEQNCASTIGELFTILFLTRIFFGAFPEDLIILFRSVNLVTSVYRGGTDAIICRSNFSFFSPPTLGTAHPAFSYWFQENLSRILPGTRVFPNKSYFKWHSRKKSPQSRNHNIVLFWSCLNASVWTSLLERGKFLIRSLTSDKNDSLSQCNIILNRVNLKNAKLAAVCVHKRTSADPASWRLSFALQKGIWARVWPFWFAALSCV